MAQQINCLDGKFSLSVLPFQTLLVWHVTPQEFLRILPPEIIVFGNGHSAWSRWFDAPESYFTIGHAIPYRVFCVQHCLQMDMAQTCCFDASICKASDFSHPLHVLPRRWMSCKATVSEAIEPSIKYFLNFCFQNVIGRLADYSELRSSGQAPCSFSEQMRKIS